MEIRKPHCLGTCKFCKMGKDEGKKYRRKALSRVPGTESEPVSEPGTLFFSALLISKS